MALAQLRYCPVQALLPYWSQLGMALTHGPDDAGVVAGPDPGKQKTEKADIIYSYYHPHHCHLFICVVV